MAAMFDDRRSRRVILVAHCILNQNAKIDLCARYPGAMREVAEYLVASGAGIVQMPCPEMACLGLDREAEAQSLTTIESEDTRVARRMHEAAAGAVCRRLAEDVAGQVREYARHGFEVAGILGINGSPTCGVETNWWEGEEAAGPGVFIGHLAACLGAGGITLPARGIKAGDPAGAVAAAEELVKPTL